MKLPYSHILYYNNHPIVNVNGTYRITDMAYPGFVSLNDAKTKVDEYEAKQKLKQLFDNQKSTNE